MGTFTGSCTTDNEGTARRPDRLHVRHSNCGYNNTDFQATLSNNTGFLFAAKYKVQALTLFGGYGWYKQANPSDDYLNGFKTIGGWNVPATINQSCPARKRTFPPHGPTTPTTM